jgi:predicted AlkP superfamily pyrophosphatase or phosphodiesterase
VKEAFATLSYLNTDLYHFALSFRYGAFSMRSTISLAILLFSVAGFAGAEDGRNVIIFVADGLRPGSINPKDTPAFAYVREKGVNFTNSHSIFPTLTMPNASAIATGHYLGDSGVFGNYLYVGFPIFDTCSFKAKKPGTLTPFIEDDQIEGDVDVHFPGQNFLHEEALLAFARTHGFSTAAIGKVGPVLIQDVTQGNPKDGASAVPDTVVIDDSTGQESGVLLSETVKEALKAGSLDIKAPSRGANGERGNNEKPGTKSANTVQQQYFVDTLTKAVLPLFKKSGKPFVVVYWSRDPDGTQHNQGDSLNKLVPGINGETSKAAVANADKNLQQILDYLKESGLGASTDLFVTADHGFSTISRRDLDSSGQNFTKSFAATRTYKDAKGQQDVNSGYLPQGFLAIDLAHHLNLKVFDPDVQIADPGQALYQPVDPNAAQATAGIAMHPKIGDALIGDENASHIAPSSAQIIVGANGGSDLIYVPSKDAKLVQKIVEFLVQQDYVSGVFTNNAYGKIDGALPLSAINLQGSALLPLPAIVVNFRTFATDPKDPLNSQVEIADYVLQQGQGMHGSFGRGDTFNNMAAIGPDFKHGFTDSAPVSNADVPVTLAAILKFTVPSYGKLSGRVISEALKDGPDAPAATKGVLKSDPAANGSVTYLRYQDLGETRYFDSAGFDGRTVDQPEK